MIMVIPWLRNFFELDLPPAAAWPIMAGAIGLGGLAVGVVPRWFPTGRAERGL